MDTKKKVLFIDRDGTLVIEPPVDYQLDSLEKLEFYPKVFRNLGFVRSKLDFEFVMVTNQDGLGTSSFPEETFWPAHNLMLKTLAGEGIAFDDILIDRSFPEDNAPTRKPRTGMLTKYIDNPDYDLAGSFVIGDRPTDVELAKNLGCRAIYLQDSTESLKEKGLENVCALATTDWDQIAEFLFAGERKAEVRRTTKETDIYVALNLDGSGICDISTGLGFFDHMLEQIGKHSGMDLTIRVKGDLEVDEHHTIEDTAIALGECINQALGWATYNGDHMSMYGVNASVPKTLVKYLVQWVAENGVDEDSKTTLLDIVDTPISPELIPADENGEIKQKTEDLVGPYELHDFFLYYFLRFGFRPSKIYYLANIAFKGNYDEETIKKWLAIFFRRFFNQQFKRSCLPDGPKVGSISISPRGDWRMPSDANSAMWLKEIEAL